MHHQTAGRSYRCPVVQPYYIEDWLILGAPLSYSVSKSWDWQTYLMNLVIHSIKVHSFKYYFPLLCTYLHIFSYNTPDTLFVLTLFVLFHTCFISYSKLTAYRRRVYSDHPFWSNTQTVKVNKGQIISKRFFLAEDSPKKQTN